MKRKPGRPRHDPDEVKSAPLAFRAAPTLRRLLDEAREKSGRSIAAELEVRVRASFNLPIPNQAEQFRQILREELLRANRGL